MGKHFGLTAKFSQNMLALIDESARKIFNNLPVVPYRTGSKLLKQKPYGPIWASYYNADNVADGLRTVSPGFKTELEERRLSALNKAKKAGKGPPKKGQGKRASKK